MNSSDYAINYDISIAANKGYRRGKITLSIEKKKSLLKSRKKASYYICLENLLKTFRYFLQD